MKKRKLLNSRYEDVPETRKLHIREIDAPEEDQYTYAHDWKPAGGGWWRIVKPLR